MAAHFAREFRTRVEVTPATPAPPGAYDPERRQMNSAAILDALERRFPTERAVVIALTEADMYIPGLSWRYAFSSRSRDRLAVVSTARMDRGCLGLFRADKERRLARLRKMLDAMSDRF